MTTMESNGFEYFYNLVFILDILAHQIKSHWSTYINKNPNYTCPPFYGLYN